MREKILIVLFFAAIALSELFPNVSAQDAADKAQQILAQARAAIGGEKLKSLQGLSVEGEFRRGSVAEPRPGNVPLLPRRTDLS